MFAAFNFGDTELKDYELTLPGKGKITPLLNSDWNCFGGGPPAPKPCAANNHRQRKADTCPLQRPAVPL